MNPNRFDQIAKALAAGVSRRQIIFGLGGAGLAGIIGTGRSRGLAAQTDDVPPPSARRS